jgi:hypothetical protein
VIKSKLRGTEKSTGRGRGWVFDIGITYVRSEVWLHLYGGEGLLSLWVNIEIERVAGNF